jgi:hypothetical protein
MTRPPVIASPNPVTASETRQSMRTQLLAWQSIIIGLAGFQTFDHHE